MEGSKKLQAALKRWGWTVVTKSTKSDDYHSSHSYWEVRLTKPGEEDRVYRRVWLDAALEAAVRDVAPLASLVKL